MRNSVFQKRIPTILGFLLVGVGILLSSWFLQTGALIPIQAATGTTPQNVRISNVSDTSFTISYTTTDPVIGYITHSSGSGEEVRTLDERDTASGEPQQRILHYITLRDLKPGSSTSYIIISGEKEYMKDGAPFSFTTPATLEAESSPINISGQAQLGDISPGVVYVSLPDSQMISSLTSDEGSFSLSYSPLRSKDFLSALTFTGSSPATILITNGVDSSKISTILEKGNPLPIVSLSQNYDFTIGISPVGEFNASDSADLAGFPSFTADEDEEEVSTAEITTPEKGEGFSDQQPQFTGRALPNEEVEIIVHSEEEIKSTVKSNSRGAWSFRPSTPLSPGEHTITIRTRDGFGILKELQQSFVVYAEGSQFADPSVSPVRTPTLTVTPTPRLSSPTISMTVTPTIIPEPSVTGSPTPFPTTAIALSITPAQPPPAAGSPALILSGIVGVATLSVGLFVLFMSKGGAL